MLNGSYETGYEDKLSLFKDLLRQTYGAPSSESSLREVINRIELKGNAVNNVLLSDVAQSLDNTCFVSVKQEATVNQIYVDLDSIELILSDETLESEFFNKIASLGSNVYTIREKQIDNIGLLIRFIK